jgi:hypothetical protein
MRSGPLVTRSWHLKCIQRTTLFVNRGYGVSWKKPVTVIGQTTALLFGLGLLETPAFAQSCSQPVPAPWQSTDIGDVGTPGRACQGPDGDLFVWGAGSDIWGTEDSFHFVYLPQPIRDGRIAAPAFVGTGDPFAKGGVMIRQSLDPASPFVILDVKPDGNVEFMTRSAAGGETTFLAGGDQPRGRYLTLRRSRGVVSAELCNGPGGACEPVGSTPWSSGPALVGFAVTSHDPTRLYQSGVPANTPSVFPLPQPWLSGDLGTVGQPGHTLFEGDSFFVTGAGSDIWGDADSFHFMSQWTRDDSEIVARVVSEDNTHPFAKAGVMMREGSGFRTSPGSPAVILDVRPGGEIEFMARSATGEDMVFVAGGFMPAPVWLRLARTGNTVTAFISDNGSNWQRLGAVDVALSADNPWYLVGLAVTSHDPDVLNTAIVDNVSVTR